MLRETFSLPYSRTSFTACSPTSLFSLPQLPSIEMTTSKQRAPLPHYVLAINMRMNKGQMTRTQIHLFNMLGSSFLHLLIISLQLGFVSTAPATTQIELDSRGTFHGTSHSTVDECRPSESPYAPCCFPLTVQANERILLRQG